MRFTTNYLYLIILLFSIAIMGCNSDEDDSINAQEETPKEEIPKELVTNVDGFTTTDTSVELPETSFGNETDCKQAEDDVFNAEFLKLVNAHRESIGVGKLTQNVIANYLAFKHTKYMICTKDFDHTNFSETGEILRKTVKSGGAAENIIAGYNTPQKMLDGWLSSPGHKTNIENSNYTFTGFSTIKKPQGGYWATQIFYN